LNYDLRTIALSKFTRKAYKPLVLGFWEFSKNWWFSCKNQH
jgi:hypothetical protein